MRHVRGKYVVFADADGASRFEDLGKLIQACKKVEDAEGRGVAVGSRAHLVGSEAVVKVRTCFCGVYVHERTDLGYRSGHSYEIYSCTLSIYFFDFLRPPLPRQ